jgi:hypothetical protein
VTKLIFAFRNFANAANKDDAEEPQDREQIFSSIHTTLPTICVLCALEELAMVGRPLPTFGFRNYRLHDPTFDTITARTTTTSNKPWFSNATSVPSQCIGSSYYRQAAGIQCIVQVGDKSHIVC